MCFGFEYFDTWLQFFRAFANPIQRHQESKRMLKDFCELLGMDFISLVKIKNCSDAEDFISSNSLVCTSTSRFRFGFFQDF